MAACRNTLSIRYGSFGIRKGDRVAYFLPNGVDLIVLYLAIQAMGAVAVPVNYRFTSEEVGCLVNASGAEALIYAARTPKRRH